MGRNGKFQFAIDRGGTFTDIYAKCPGGKIRVMKLLSVDPENYPDAPREGIRRILEEPWLRPIKSEQCPRVPDTSLHWSFNRFAKLREHGTKGKKGGEPKSIIHRDGNASDKMSFYSFLEAIRIF
uniref:Hydantoinase/oxoprolinase N-terminal domain-containing protein n=1 Tax=Timema poppense TaxID=170557 RepID=A0A7R9H2N7_TIMPO|nr:unnamed protein product [Timema poppensis]